MSLPSEQMSETEKVLILKSILFYFVFIRTSRQTESIGDFRATVEIWLIIILETGN